MKYATYFLISVCILFGIHSETYAQAPIAVAFGDTSYGFRGSAGIVDASGNLVMAGRDANTANFRNEPHLAFFDKNFSYKWSFTLDTVWGIGQKVIQTSEKNYVAVFSECIVTKFDSMGNVLWFRQLNTPFSEFYSDILEDKNANLFLIGHNGVDAVITKLDPSGNLVWCYGYTYTSPCTHYGMSIIPTQDGNFLCCGTLNGGSFARESISAFKIDHNGNLLWSAVYTSSATTMRVQKMIQSKVDRSYFGVGYSNVTNDYNYIDAFSIKIDSVGSLINSKSMGYMYRDFFSDVCQAENGEFVAVGTSRPTLTCGGSLLYSRFSHNNDTLYTKMYGNNGASSWSDFKNVKPNLQGDGFHSFGYGITWSTIEYNYDYVFLRTDSLLNIPCAKFTQPLTQSTPVITTQMNVINKKSIAVTFDTTYFKKPTTMHSKDACTGIPLIVEDEASNRDGMLYVYPNPAGEQVYLEFDEPNTNFLVRIRSISGQLLHEERFQKSRGVLKTYNLPNGIYLVEVSTHTNHQTVKLIVQH